MAFEGAPEPADRTEVILYKIAKGIWNMLSGVGAFLGLTDTQLRATPVPVSLGSYPSGTLAIFAKTAGETETIPIGAFQIGIVFLTGTGTIGGVDWPVGVPLNIQARTAATIAVVCGSPGTARVQYLT